MVPRTNDSSCLGKIGFNFYIILCVWVFFLRVCLGTTCVPEFADSEEGIRFSGVKLQIVSHHVGARNEAQDPSKEQSVLLTESSLHFP